MQYYTLNSAYQRDKIIEGYFSLIWTERFRAMGDFEIQVPDTAYWASTLAEGTILIHSETDEPMIVETATVTEDDSGKIVRKVTGRTPVMWLETRVVVGATILNSTTSQAVQGILNAAIFNQAVGDLGWIPEFGLINYAGDTDKYDFENLTGEIYDATASLLNTVDVGYRVRFSKTSPRFVLNMYGGLPTSVVFSERNGTLIKPGSVTSSEKLRNCAIISYKANQDQGTGISTRRVYANGGKDSDRGLKRRDTSVNATSVNSADYSSQATFLAAIDRLGRLALGKAKHIDSVDGEVPAYSQFKYRKDYFMGDRVKFQRASGTKQIMRVVEYIWSDDENGPKAYPSFEEYVGTET